MWATLLETLIQCDESKNNSKWHSFPLPPNSFYFSHVWIPSGQILKKIRILKKIYHGLPYTKIDVDVFWLWLPTHAPWWCVKREKLHTTYLSHHWEASHMTRDTATMSHTLESHFPICDAFLESMCCSDPLHIKPQCLATQSENLQDHFQFCSVFLDSCLHGTYLNRMWQGMVLPVDIISIPAGDILPYYFLSFLRLSLNYGTPPSLFSFQSPLLSCPL